MTYKPMDPKIFKKYLRLLGWSIRKSRVDWSVYDENGDFVCSIIISHGNTKSEVVAHSVHKVKTKVIEKGKTWPPTKS